MNATPPLNNLANANQGQQVFFDPTRRRWRFVAAIVVVIMMGFAAPFIGLAMNIVDGLDFSQSVDIAVIGGDPSSPPAQVPPGIPTAAAIAAADLRPATPVDAAPPEQGAVPLQRFAYLASDDDPSVDSVFTNLDKIDVVLVEWYYLAGPEGRIAEFAAPGRTVRIESVVGARPGLRVIPVIDDEVDGVLRSDAVSRLLSDRTARRRFADNLVRFAQLNGFDGVNLAFRGLDETTMTRYERFVGELQRTFAPLGLSVIVTADLEDPLYRIDVLARAADTVIVDTFNRDVNAERPDAPAPNDWFARTLAARTAGVDATKIVVGIANYGYDWNRSRATVSSIGSQVALRLAEEHKASIRFDKASLNPTFAYRDQAGDDHTVWYLDAVTTFNQIQAIRSLDIPGVAVGRLGGEDATIWLLLRTAGALDAALAQALGEISFRYHIDYIGEGAVLQVGGHSEPGVRAIAFDEESGLIVDERIEVFPTVPTATLRGPTKPGRIALTFDDGPDPTFTNAILDILKEHGAKATFFVIGRNIVRHPDILRRIVDEGHEIANHTFYHPNVSLISGARLQMELSATQKAMETTVGRRSYLFRPPYGEEMTPTSPDHMAPLAIASAAGYYTVGYTIDPLDWKTTDAAAIVQRTVEGARADKGGIVLLHDGGGNRTATVTALPQILATLTEAGFRFATLSEVMEMPRDILSPPLANRYSPLNLLQNAAFFLLRFGHFFMIGVFVSAIGLSVLRVGLIVILALRNRRPRRDNVDYLPEVTVIVPAHNEEKVIAKTIRSLLASSYPKMHVLVIDDGSTDRTADVVAERFADEPRVQVVRKPNGGKATALNLGFALSQAEIVVAMDADTIFRPDAIYHLTRPFADPKVGAVAGNAKVGNRVNLMTRWQALEYIVSQNLDRRAFELINAIAVVPGAVGAWRRAAVEAVGGFASDTLAEDCDLTIRINLAGYTVRNASDAVAMTEAPDTVRGFLAQRSRWTLGTLQAAWKSRRALLRPRSGAVGMVILPHIFVFQFLLPLLSPLADFFVILALGDAALQKYYHPTQALPQGLDFILYAYLAFVLIDVVVAFVAYSHEAREDRRLLLWLPVQRFFYRQLLYYVAVKSFVRALSGTPQGWRSVARKATVSGGLSMQHWKPT